jgi:hypothetical protein
MAFVVVVALCSLDRVWRQSVVRAARVSQSGVLHLKKTWVGGSGGESIVLCLPITSSDMSHK